MTNQKHTLLVVGLGLGLASLLPGCYAHASGGVVYGEPVVYVDSPPERVESYPSAEYHSRPAYYAEGRWYYRDSGRWVVFRDEPTELRDYRVRTIQSGGPAAVRFRQAPQPYAREAEDRRRDQQRADVRRADDQRRQEAQRQQERQRAEAQRRAEDQQRADAQRRMNDQHRAEAEQAERSREAARNAEARKRAGDKRDRRADDDDDRDPRAQRRRVVPN